jgi:hypothetical protein
VSTSVVSNYTFGTGYKVGQGMAVRLFVNATTVTATLDGSVVATLRSGSLVDGLPGFFGLGTGWFDDVVVTTQCDGGYQCLSTSTWRSSFMRPSAPLTSARFCGADALVFVFASRCQPRHSVLVPVWEWLRANGRVVRAHLRQ